jgi:N utilization substance protein B
MCAKKKTIELWLPTQFHSEFSETRSGAVAWLVARRLYPKQDEKLLKKLLSECYPQANFDDVEAIVNRHPPYHDVSSDIVETILDMTHLPGYEILLWREETMRVLILDCLSSLKSSSAQLIEDAISRVTQSLDSKLRGSTKNACQIIAGQRTKLRKMVRLLSMSCLYLIQFRPTLTIKELIENVHTLVIPMQNNEPAFEQDDNPFRDFAKAEGKITHRGLFAINETEKFIRNYLPHREIIDILIQKTSKKWRLSRMSPVDLNIIRVATYEILYDNPGQPRVFINEAIELSKTYGAEQSGNFVNGILQQLCTDSQINLDTNDGTVDEHDTTNS